MVWVNIFFATICNLPFLSPEWWIWSFFFTSIFNLLFIFPNGVYTYKWIFLFCFAAICKLLFLPPNGVTDHFLLQFAFSFPRMVWVNSFQNSCFAAICRLFKLSRRNHATKVSTSSKRLFTISSRLWRNLKMYPIINQTIPKIYSQKFSQQLKMN